MNIAEIRNVYAKPLYDYTECKKLVDTKCKKVHTGSGTTS